MKNPTAPADLPCPQVLPDVLEEHLRELDFLWEQRERFRFSPAWTLRDLAEIEARAEAHLDGLRIGGAHSVELARPFLSADETGIATAAAFVFFAFDRPELETEVVHVFEAAPPKGREGLRIALRHVDVTRVAPALTEFATAAVPAVRAAAADVLAFHRFPPPQGMVSLLEDPDPDVRRLAYEAAGRFGGPWSQDMLRNALDHDPAPLRLAALRASARMGLPGLGEICRDAATRAESPVPEALAFLGVLGDPQDLPLIFNGMSRPGLAIAALEACGSLGCVAAVPTLLDAMTNPRLAHAAGRAFVRITGAEDIEASKPLPQADLTEEEAENWDESLPPDAEKARNLWQRICEKFSLDATYQQGDLDRGTTSDPVSEGLALGTALDIFLRSRARATKFHNCRDFEQRTSPTLRSKT